MVVLAGCSAFNLNGGQKGDDYQAFVRLQENLVDREETEGLLIQRNIMLEEEVSKLENDLNSLVRDIEERNLKETFIEEKIAGTELPNPGDRISDRQIRVWNNRVVIDVNDLYWLDMLESNSMDPLLDEGTTVLGVRPGSATDREPGDIIVFRSDKYQNNVVHRVVEVRYDNDGYYYITKGDNNPDVDPFHVRFKDVVVVVVGVLY